MINVIKLKLRYEAVFLLNKEILEFSKVSKIDTIEDKFYHSMCLDLSTIFFNRCLKYITNNNSKDCKLSFKYHQAYLLYKIVLQRLNTTKYQPYENTLLDNIKNILHKQLIIN